MIKKNQQGQAIIILLIVMVIALTVGVAISQRSTSDISTSTQSEQSSQAFSAAEAGIETAIRNNLSSQTLNLGNQSQATVTKTGILPFPGSPLGIEYPPIDKETTAQFWLADPDPNRAYTKDSFEVWFGNPVVEPGDVPPAIEVNVISQVGPNYQSFRYYFDSDPNRAASSHFNTCTRTNATRDTILKTGSNFYCYATIPPTGNCTFAPCDPYRPNNSSVSQLVRVRLLYSKVNQKVAIIPTQGGFFPPQIELYNSVGTSGQSQIALQYFKQHDLVPPWFDFAIFSVKDISK